MINERKKCMPWAPADILVTGEKLNKATKLKKAPYMVKKASIPGAQPSGVARVAGARGKLKFCAPAKKS